MSSPEENTNTNKQPQQAQLQSFSTFASRYFSQPILSRNEGNDNVPLFVSANHGNDLDADDGYEDDYYHQHYDLQPRRTTSQPGSSSIFPSTSIFRHQNTGNRNTDYNNDNNEDDDNLDGSNGSELLGRHYNHNDSSLNPFEVDTTTTTGHQHNDNEGDDDDHDNNPFIVSRPLPSSGSGWKMHQTHDSQQIKQQQQQQKKKQVGQEPYHDNDSYDTDDDQSSASTQLRLEASYRRHANIDQSLASSYASSAPRFHKVFFRSEHPKQQQAQNQDPRQIPLLAEEHADSSTTWSPSSHSPTFSSRLSYPRPSIATSRQSHTYHRLRTRDKVWVNIYFFCSFILGIIALYSAFSPPPLPQLFVISLPLLTLSAFVAFVLGSIYTLLLVLLRHGAARPILYTSIVLPALSLLLTCIFSFASSWRVQSASIAKSIRWASGIAFIFAGFMTKSAWKNLDRVQRTAHVLELASEVILANSPLIFFSFALTCVFLIGSLLISLLVLTLSDWHPTVSVFATFFGLWTLGIIRGVFRLVVTGVVGNWFFNRHEPYNNHTESINPDVNPDATQAPTQVFRAALSRALGPSFGTAIVSGLALTFVDTISFALAQLFKLRQRAASTTFPSPFSLLLPIFWMLTPLLVLLEAYIDIFNSYVLVFAGLSGDGFWESTKAVTGIIRSTGTQAVADRLLIKRILSMAALVVSSISSLTLLISLYSGASSTVDLANREAGEVVILIILSGLIPYWIIRVSSDLLSNATDILFISYAIDMADGTTHSVKAGEVFGELSSPNEQLPV